MKESDNAIWKCPKCNHVITNIEMQHARYNYPCPRCSLSRLCDFILIVEHISKTRKKGA